MKFDKNSSLFAVYDGHGGAEVALYCADKLPSFLRQTDAYVAKNYEQALKDAFIGFDALLIQDDIQAELQKLNNSTKTGCMESETEEDAEDVEDDIELDELRQEGQMPLDELLEKYHDGCGKKNPILGKLKKDENIAGSSKPISPYLRGARGSAGIQKNVDDTTAGSSSNICKKLCDDEGGVSSSSSKQNIIAQQQPGTSVDCSGMSSSSGSSSGSTPQSNGTATSTSDTIKDQMIDNTPDSSSASKLVESSTSEIIDTNKSEKLIKSSDQSVSNGEVTESTNVINGIDQENKISTNSDSSKVISENVTSSSIQPAAAAAGSSSSKGANGQVTVNSLPALDDGGSSSTEDDNDLSYNGKVLSPCKFYIIF